MIEVLIFVVAGVLVVLGGWLAACESALSVTSSSDIERLADGARQRKALLAIAPAVSEHVLAVSLSRVVSETAAAVLVTIGLVRVLPTWWLALIIAAVVMVVVSFILVGSSPRSVGRAHSEGILRASAGFIRWQRLVLGPLAQLLVRVGDRVTPGRRVAMFESEAQLLSMVDEAAAQSVLDTEDRELIHSVFELGSTIVREVMVPRPDIVSIGAGTKASDAVGEFLEHGVSRMPVMGEGNDEVLGIVHLRDVVHRAFYRRDDVAIEQLARAPLWLPESKTIDDALEQLRAERVHLALVTDEWGSLAGLVTLEDLVEELVGEISDEYDREVSMAERDGDAWLVSSRMPIDELGELFALDVDDEDVDTVGGFVAKHLGRLAEPGDRLATHGLHLDVVSIDGRGGKLGTVRVARGEAHEEVIEA